MEKPFYQLNKYIQILVADDIADLRKQWCWFLQEEGYSTCEAASADEVLSKIGKVHIVLLDYYINGSPTGPELIRKIRSIREKDLGIIIITGNVMIRRSNIRQENMLSRSPATFMIFPMPYYSQKLILL